MSDAINFNLSDDSHGNEVSRILARMSGGYMLLVRTPRVGGGEDATGFWFAHIPDQKEAVQAVEAQTRPASGAKITVLGTVRHAVLVDQLGVSEGSVKNVAAEPVSAP